ncbi:phage integrase SAM-like domain-containing protein [bacterium]|nr:phage integrase SAM-like domain-containing protein [bacterium]
MNSTQISPKMQVENRRQLSLRAIPENYQQLFGLPADKIYVNNAAVGLIPKTRVDAMKTFADEQYRTGLPAMESIGEKFAQILLLVGSRIGTPAENIRTKRQLEFQNSAYGFTARFKRKANFITYCEKMTIKTLKSHFTWPNTLRYLKFFSGGTLPFSTITKQWLENFQQYLLGQVSPNSANKYFSMIKIALKNALKEKHIEQNPA